LFYSVLKLLSIILLFLSHIILFSHLHFKLHSSSYYIYLSYNSFITSFSYSISILSFIRKSICSFYSIHPPSISSNPIRNISTLLYIHHLLHLTSSIFSTSHPTFPLLIHVIYFFYSTLSEHLSTIFLSILFFHSNQSNHYHLIYFLALIILLYPFTSIFVHLYSLSSKQHFQLYENLITNIVSFIVFYISLNIIA
jgi:hypothetical protein